MPFPFNFAFSVPGIANPFSPQESLRSSPTPGSPTQGTKKPKLGMNGKIFGASRAVKSDLLRRRPSTPSLELPQPTSRKRGWVPSSSEPSIPTTVPATVQTSTSSRLNSPLINQGVMQHTNDQDQQDHDEMEGGEYSYLVQWQRRSGQADDLPGIVLLLVLWSRECIVLHRVPACPAWRNLYLIS